MSYISYSQQFLKDITRRVHQTLRGLVGETPRTYPRVFFLHFEKCGGSTVAHAFRKQLKNFAYHDFSRFHTLFPEKSLSASSQLGRPVFEYRENLLHYFLSNETLRFVGGHFQVSPDVLEAYQESWQFMTLLREPVSRWLSHYFYNRFKNRQHAAITVSIDEYLHTTRAQALGQDYINLLTGTGDYQEGKSLAQPSKDHIEKAKDVIDRFDVIGTLDHFEEFEQEVREDLEWPIRIGHENKSPVSEKKKEKEVSPAIREKIEDLCAPNKELYRHVVQGGKS
jgi:hypothetical protein